MSDLRDALQRVIRARKALDAITPCPSTTTLVRYIDGRPGPVRCELVEHHELMTGAPHRARLGGAQRVQWDDQEVNLVIEP